MISVLFGVLPRFSEDAVQADERPPRLVGLADIFKAGGYETAYIHNGELDFERMGSFFEEHRFDTVIGELDLLDVYPDAHRFSWGVHDEHLMEYALDWLEARDEAGSSAFVTMFTISNHHPWELPSSWTPVDVSVSADETHGRFLRAMHYSDAALGAFVDGLRARGLAERTILFITADTSQAMGERDGSFALSRSLHEENLRIPLLILADGRLDSSRHIDSVGSQVDLLPTIMDVVHLSGRHHAVGHTLKRIVPDRRAYFSSPFALGYWGVRAGRWKYFQALRSHTHYLYDLVADPGETNNLADEQPALVARYELAVARMHRLFTALYGRDAFVL